MTERMDGVFRTLTVIRSGPSATADGQIAIVIETAEAGTIALAVSRQAITVLRRQLAELEAFLDREPGQA